MEESVSITRLCTIIQVSRQSYYQWLKRQNTPKTKRQLENEWLEQTVRTVFNEFNGIYGYRRIMGEINRRFHKEYNRKRIQRIMRKLGLYSVIRRNRHSCTVSGYCNVTENILGRNFAARYPNEKWLTDVTYLELENGQKVYLSAIKDLYDGQIISYRISPVNDFNLVHETLLTARQAEPEAQPLLHSDRGSQYTSKAYVRLMTEWGYTRSMSRVGKCIDNGPMESFWGHFKDEWYNWGTYPTLADLQASIDEFMNFYNNDRIQERLGFLTPAEFRAQAA